MSGSGSPPAELYMPVGLSVITLFWIIGVELIRIIMPYSPLPVIVLLMIVALDQPLVLIPVPVQENVFLSIVGLDWAVQSTPPFPTKSLDSIRG